MTPDDAISLFAELSLGLAGFAGVGAAFAGRSREFLPLERMRLISVVSLSASVLAGSLAYVTVSFASESASLRASAATSLAASLGMLFLIGPPLIRARSRSSAESERWVLPASIGLLLVALWPACCCVLLAASPRSLAIRPPSHAHQLKTSGLTAVLPSNKQPCCQAYLCRHRFPLRLISNHRVEDGE
jgi:hypothetical protein